MPVKFLEMVKKNCLVTISNENLVTADRYYNYSSNAAAYSETD